ncbi:translocation/assembly module TamB domain-containing protein [Legionella sp. 29fVS95]|uniref:translocation/assembly module TamB domain-containing protein n=1 Tax=Legionella sp. 29fVS95 TaxID=3402813 RepID=UPI003AF645A9
MRFLITALRSTFYSLFLLFILVISLFIFLVTTTPGLYVTAKLATIFLPGQLHFERLQGRLIDQLSFKHLRYQHQQFAVELSNFQLKWQVSALFHHQITIEHLNADSLTVDLSPQKAGAEKTNAQLPQLPFVLSIKDASIKQTKITQAGMLHQIDAINLQARLTSKQWKLKKLAMNLNQIAIIAEAKLQPQLPFTASAALRFKSANKIFPLEGKLDLGGDFFLYHWHGEFTNPAPLTLNGTLRNGYEIHSTAQWQAILWPLYKAYNLESSKGEIHVDGSPEDLTLRLKSTLNSPLAAEWEVNSKITPHSINAVSTVKSAQGRIDFNCVYNALNSPQIQGQMTAQSFDAEINPLSSLRQLKLSTAFAGDSLGNLSLKSNLTARYRDNLLKAVLDYQNQQLKGKIILGANQLRLSGKAPYQLQATASFPQLQLLHPDLAGLKTSITAKASLSSATKGEALIRVRPGSYQLPDDSLLSSLPFTGGEFRVALNPQHLLINGKLTIDPHKQLVLNLKLPQFQLQKGLANGQSLRGSLRLDVNSLAFLSNLNKEISKAEGQLHAILNAKGTITKPIIDGLIQLEKASFSLPKQGLVLNPVQIKVQSQAQHWETQGSVVSNGRPLTLKGNGVFSPAIRGTITLMGDSVPLINTPEYQIHVSPNLNFEFTPTSLAMKGTLLIPHAEIKPQSFSNSVSLTGDAVFAGKEQPPPNPLHLDTDVRVEMGNDVAITVQGLRGFLTGAIRLRQLPQGPLTASGELNIRDGQYKAYGQDLTIKQGQLLFTGGLIDNPGIHVRAVRQFTNANSAFAGSNELLDFNATNLKTVDFGSKTTVGIEVTGRLNAPKVALFSNPPTLQQADILSLLILGKPIDRANKSGGQLLLAAISSMNLDSGTGGLQMIDQVKQTLGLDFNYETNSKYNYNTKQTIEKKSVIVGKSLSKRLYLSYNFGLAQSDSNVLTLTYLLNKFFSIQVNASLTASGIDILYTRRKE